MRKIAIFALPFAAGLLFVGGMCSSAAAAAVHPITVTPNGSLTNGQSVTVSSSGWPAATTVFVLECADTSGAATCDTSHLLPVTTDNQGAFSTSFTVRTGAIGNKSCNPGSSCFIAAGTANQSDAGAAPIHFKSAAVATPAPTAATAATPAPAPASVAGQSPTAATAAGQAATAAAPTPASSVSGDANDVPVTVSAGSGGTADHQSLPLLPVVVGIIGLATAGAGARLLRR